MFFSRFVIAHQVTDVVLFGDCRPLHRAAHIIATVGGCRIWVFEEGYIRPDWMTLEHYGVNARSTLPSDALWFVEAAAHLPPIPALPMVPSNFNRRIRDTARYFIQTGWQAWRFPGFVSHRPSGALQEGKNWIVQRLARQRMHKRTEATLADLAESSYFLLPLQLNSDFQLRAHSDFPDMASAVFMVLESFARHGPADAKLLVKRHPLDFSGIAWRRIICAQAEALGIAQRTVFIETGDIGAIVEAARGVVTVNSTVGTLALGVGKPTIVLGKAIYDIDGVTHQGGLDDFWSRPIAPDADIWQAFRRVLYHRCLIHGGLSSDEGVDMLIKGAVQRMTTEPTGDLPIVHRSAARRPTGQDTIKATLSSAAIRSPHATSMSMSELANMMHLTRKPCG
ncbi:MAG: capsular polysaccharide export protein, LipB/KpsS family [Caulobacteraceae bacterium]